MFLTPRFWWVFSGALWCIRQYFKTFWRVSLYASFLVYSRLDSLVYSHLDCLCVVLTTTRLLILIHLCFTVCYVLMTSWWLELNACNVCVKWIEQQFLLHTYWWEMSKFHVLPPWFTIDCKTNHVRKQRYLNILLNYTI